MIPRKFQKSFILSTLVNAMIWSFAGADAICLVDDVQAELEAVQKQREANMSLFSFDTHTHVDDGDEADVE